MMIQRQKVSLIRVVVVEFTQDSIESIQCGCFRHLLIAFRGTQLACHQLT